MILELRTERLLLRGWRASAKGGDDREPFAEMSADAEVMRYFPRLLTREESDAWVDRYAEGWASHGFGVWAVEIPGVTPFAGLTGLGTVTFPASFTPCIEIGWRIARPFWGRGYATEAARAALEFGFTRLGLERIYAFTVPANTRSRRVMEKLGMSFLGEFAHPLFETDVLAVEHPLRRHVLYAANTR